MKNGKEGHVYVTRVTKGSLSAECLIVGDRILQIDGTIINDKEMAKKIIVQVNDKLTVKVNKLLTCENITEMDYCTEE